MQQDPNVLVLRQNVNLIVIGEAKSKGYRLATRPKRNSSETKSELNSSEAKSDCKKFETKHEVLVLTEATFELNSSEENSEGNCSEPERKDSEFLLRQNLNLIALTGAKS